MADREASIVRRAATGAAAGLVAGLLGSLAMDVVQRLTQPAADEEGEPATEQAAAGLARDVTGQPLPDNAKPVGGQLVHYGLGAAVGIGYGIAAELAPGVTLGAGTLFSTGVWAALDEAAVPALKLGDPPWKASPGQQAYSFASHLVFGLVAEGARRLVRERLDRPQEATR